MELKHIKITNFEEYCENFNETERAELRKNLTEEVNADINSGSGVKLYYEPTCNEGEKTAYLDVVKMNVVDGGIDLTLFYRK